MKVEDIMTREVVTISRDMTLREVAETFAVHGVEGLPVVDDDGTVAGLVTRRDLLRLFIPEYLDMFDDLSFVEHFGELEPESFFAAGGTLFLVEDIMSRRFAWLTPESSLLKAVVTMDREGTNALLVLREGKLVGVLTRGDLYQAFFGKKRRT